MTDAELVALAFDYIEGKTSDFVISLLKKKHKKPQKTDKLTISALSSRFGGLVSPTEAMLALIGRDSDRIVVEDRNISGGSFPRSRW